MQVFVTWEAPEDQAEQRSEPRDTQPVLSGWSAVWREEESFLLFLLFFQISHKQKHQKHVFLSVQATCMRGLSDQVETTCHMKHGGVGGICKSPALSGSEDSFLGSITVRCFVYLLFKMTGRWDEANLLWSSLTMRRNVPHKVMRS